MNYKAKPMKRIVIDFPLIRIYDHSINNFAFTFQNTKLLKQDDPSLCANIITLPSSIDSDKTLKFATTYHEHIDVQNQELDQLNVFEYPQNSYSVDAWTGFIVGKDEKPLYYRDLVVSKFEDYTGEKAHFAEPEIVYLVTETNLGPALVNLKNHQDIEQINSVCFEFNAEFIEIIGTIYENKQEIPS